MIVNDIKKIIDSKYPINREEIEDILKKYRIIDYIITIEKIESYVIVIISFVKNNKLNQFIHSKSIHLKSKGERVE